MPRYCICGPSHFSALVSQNILQRLPERNFRAWIWVLLCFHFSLLTPIGFLLAFMVFGYVMPKVHIPVRSRGTVLARLEPKEIEGTGTQYNKYHRGCLRTWIKIQKIILKKKKHLIKSRYQGYIIFVFTISLVAPQSWTTVLYVSQGPCFFPLVSHLNRTKLTPTPTHTTLLCLTYHQ